MGVWCSTSARGSTTIDEPGRLSVDVDLTRPAAPGARFVRADAQALPFRDGAFDAIVAKDVIEHVDDVSVALVEMRRVARSGSQLVVLTPRAVPRAVWADPTHKRGFTAGALISSLAGAGWVTSASPRRMGSVPLAGRAGIGLRGIEAILRVPALGHWFGTNHLVTVTASDESV